MTDEEYLKDIYRMVLASWKDFKKQTERILPRMNDDGIWDEYIQSVSERGRTEKSRFQRQLDSVFLVELERRVLEKGGIK